MPMFCRPEEAMIGRWRDVINLRKAPQKPLTAFFFFTICQSHKQPGIVCISRVDSSKYPHNTVFGNLFTTPLGFVQSREPVLIGFMFTHFGKVYLSFYTFLFTQFISCKIPNKSEFCGQSLWSNLFSGGVSI